MKGIRTSTGLVGLLATALLIAGCDQGAKPPTGAYDVGKMDLEPGPC